VPAVAEKSSPADEVDPRLAGLCAEFQRVLGWPTDEDNRSLDFAKTYKRHFSDKGLKDLDAATFREFISSREYGYTGVIGALNRFLDEADEEDEERLRGALRHLLHGPGPVEERLAAVIDRDGEMRVPGLAEVACAKVLAVMDPSRFLPVFRYKGRTGKRHGLEILGLSLGEPEDDLSAARLAVRSNDLLVAALKPHLGHTLEMARFLSWARARLAGEDDASDPIDALAAQTHRERELLLDFERVLRWRKHVALVGPSGVGKTFIARAFADYFARSSSRVRFIQLHPSFGYADFVERRERRRGAAAAAARKKGAEHEAGETVSGIFKALCERARADEGQPYVLVVDELDRVEPESLWGEVRYLLEYRERDVVLPFSRERFGIPPNVHVIATLSEGAELHPRVAAFLRRRFAVVELQSDPRILERWLEAHDPSLRWVARLLRHLNEQVDVAIGGGLSFGHGDLMVADLDEARLEMIWRHAVLPRIKAALGDSAVRDGALAAFELENMRAVARREEAPIGLDR